MGPGRGLEAKDNMGGLDQHVGDQHVHPYPREDHEPANMYLIATFIIAVNLRRHIIANATLVAGRVTRKLPSLREHAWVRAWAYRIATRDALRHVARSRRHALTSLDAAIDVPDEQADDDSIFEAQMLAELPSAIATLPEASQLVVRLHYLHGLTQFEVAEILSIPLGTVKSRIAYALRLLRARIGSR